MLNPKDSCRLIAVNYLSFVKYPYTDHPFFDYKKFFEVVRAAVRLNDDLVDMEIMYMNRIIDVLESENDPQNNLEIDLWKGFIENAVKGRRIGLGFTGLGDTLAAMGYKYDDEGVAFVEELMRAKFQAEFSESINLAIERGPFPAFNSKYEQENDFMKMVETQFPDLYKANMIHGRRNINISTVAPTGSLSILAGLTSGLEPLFMPFYTRRKKVTEGETEDFVDDNGVKWKNHNVLHPQYAKWLKTKGADLSKLTKDDLTELFKESPWYGSTAGDLKWEDRVNMQAVIQRYTTNSISSTINLPAGTPPEIVGNIYMEAWKRGLKGVTVYVDGSRQGVLVSEETDADGRPLEITRKPSPKRPKELPADIYSVVAKGVKYVVIVGMLKEEPYEVFAFQYNEDYKDLIKQSRGVLKKRAKGHYDLEAGELYRDVNLNIDSDEEIAITRLISTALRHGADMTFIVEQLNKSEGTIISFTKSIARVLKKYASARETSSVCPECGGDNYISENGCWTCKDCGYSKCG